jgi:6-pyruvoyltetrahydropterin/6-carboxytetrahydropterin synthase
MFKIRVETGFSSAHNLRRYKGKCEALHGHNWKVEAIVASEKLDKVGMVMDFKALKGLLNKLLERFDHAYLNRIAPFDKVNPTSENLAFHIHKTLKKQIPGLLSVTVWENPTSCATYEEKPL